MQNKAVFADVFNYLIYEGDAGIDPDQLQVLDTSVFSMPYGVDQKGSPVQKYRDVLM